MTLSPKHPIRADHRFMKRFINIVLGGKVLFIPSELTRISRVFVKNGGSWEKLFNGSVDEIVRLKQILKFAFDHGYLTKKESWA